MSQSKGRAQGWPSRPMVWNAAYGAASYDAPSSLSIVASSSDPSRSRPRTMVVPLSSEPWTLSPGPEPSGRVQKAGYTGDGAARVANKVRGTRAALCYDVSSTCNGQEDKHANVLTLGAGLTGAQLAWQIDEEWLAVEWARAATHAAST